jgi:hypothetical protein
VGSFDQAGAAAWSPSRSLERRSCSSGREDGGEAPAVRCSRQCWRSCPRTSLAHWSEEGSCLLAPLSLQREMRRFARPSAGPPGRSKLQRRCVSCSRRLMRSRSNSRTNRRRRNGVPRTARWTGWLQRTGLDVVVHICVRVLRRLAYGRRRDELADRLTLAAAELRLIAPPGVLSVMEQIPRVDAGDPAGAAWRAEWSVVRDEIRDGFREQLAVLDREAGSHEPSGRSDDLAGRCCHSKRALRRLQRRRRRTRGGKQARPAPRAKHRAEAALAERP